MDAPHVHVRACALGCFYSLISNPDLLEGTDRVGEQLRGDKECPFSGVTKSGRVWKMPESDARSVTRLLVTANETVLWRVSAKRHGGLAGEGVGGRELGGGGGADRHL